MAINEFIKQITELFDDTDPSEIKEDTAFQELEDWSSLTAMGIIAFVKKHFNKTVTGLEIRSCTTIKDLYTLIANK